MFLYLEITKQNKTFFGFSKIDDFDFIINLVVVFKIFDINLDATDLLQSKENDIADGLEIISSLFNLNSDYRKEVDKKHEEWYNKAMLLAKKARYC